MAYPGKRYRAASAQRKAERVYDVREAVELLGHFPKAKFDETVSVTLRLGIDAKQSDQTVRGAMSLPHGIGKELRVVAFAEGAKAEEARVAGAVFVGAGDLAEKISGGWTDFDVAVATPDMMKHVGKLGKVLGPQGKMPSPKAGTVTLDIASAVREFKAGKIEFRNDAGGNLAAPMGKRSFTREKLAENIEAFMNHVHGLKPAHSKGQFVLKGCIAPTHGPGIAIKVS
ncbi:MAG: 50S ribosomal protein L1 [Planctomycetes bacterium]|nr:50S ribosomal protein L1 [Planctomycetota bacterium]